MRLVTFRKDARDRGGVLAGDDVVLDLQHAFAWFEHTSGRPCDRAHLAERYGHGILGFVEHADAARPAADAIVAAHAAGALPRIFAGGAVEHDLASVELLAPIPRPPSIRDGYAFRQHVETARRNRGLPMIPEFDEFPVFYFTNPRAVTGPGDVAVRDAHLDRLDYELEAAVVVARAAQNLTVESADEAIFGMMIMNDWSARGLQMQEMKLNLGPAKGKDFATSFGPWLVTLDELLPRATIAGGRGRSFDLGMRASVNGRPLSRGNVGDMTWTFAQILERASYGAELAPGDVIGSGTCGTGCLLELNGTHAASGGGGGGGGGGGETEQWLAPGDAVVLEIDGLGRLENRVTLASPR